MKCGDGKQICPNIHEKPFILIYGTLYPNDNFQCLLQTTRQGLLLY